MKFSMIVQKTEVTHSLLTPPITTIPEEPLSATTNNNCKKSTPLLRSISCRAKAQIQPHAYLKNLRFRRNSISHRGAMLNLHKYKMKASSCPDLFKNSMATLRSNDEVGIRIYLSIYLCLSKTLEIISSTIYLVLVIKQLLINLFLGYYFWGVIQIRIFRILVPL